MKLIVRLSALTVVLAGAAAASFSSFGNDVTSSQIMSARLPVPTCGPGVPNCPTQFSPTMR